MVAKTELDDLVVFAMVAECLGFTAAAERLGMTKAAVSLRVRQLEARLGAALFVRTTRQVRLTDRGRALYEATTPALATLRRALDEFGTQAAELSGTLRLTAPVEFAASVLASEISAFCAEHPAVSVELHSADRVVDLVAVGMDLAIRLGELRDSSLRASRLGTFEQVVVGSPDYLRRRGHPAAPSDLSAHDWVSFVLLRAPLTWTFTNTRGRKASVKLRSRLKVDSSSALRALLERGAGLSVIDRNSVAPSLRSGALVRVLPDWRLPEGGIYAVPPPGRHSHPLARAFVAALRRRLSVPAAG